MIAPYIIGALIGAGGMALVAVYLARGWRNASARVSLGHDIIDQQQAEIAAANDAVTIAQGRASSAEDALIYTTRRLAVARQHITDIEPLASIGRRRKASIDRDSARKRAGRVGK